MVKFLSSVVTFGGIGQHFDNQFGLAIEQLFSIGRRTGDMQIGAEETVVFGGLYADFMSELNTRQGVLRRWAKIARIDSY
jgi:hypothetical protein